MEKIRLSSFEKDILGEIGTMCVGNATTALAQILGKRIELELPGVTVININKLHTYLHVDPEDSVLGIHMQVLGGAKGNALMIFPKKDAFKLVDVVIGPVKHNADNLTEIGISALKEVGNIVVSSYLSALSAFTGISAFPSTVTLTSGAARSIVNLAFMGLRAEECEYTILVEAVFKESKRNVEGNFFIILSAASMQVILKKAKAMVKDKD
ncbi:MAG: chemotaxis protein CheC [Candidatus Omnitrophica bacterium]|nr:chemotaxis protein CheC [Candidatus Omnitrophota bacterium]MDD5774907.1 chemotaxis protein CheC [Candidatus Omnitrophota bacterium]HNQ50690.1 chemotaxis protein CheC [Candidatus Omnitrophota bacterium]HQO37447.1 chemotaxis protein CheC [Candidatus Omnitrophota bacterium]HQQ05676.1 chemotaxis protein CheC [Candidatus Omnitrophota bacterium]